jgi:hypothetical protein
MPTFDERLSKRLESGVRIPGAEDVKMFFQAGPVAFERTQVLSAVLDDLGKGFRDYQELCESRGYVSMQDRWVQDLRNEGFYDEAYNQVVRFILETWANAEHDNLHEDPGAGATEMFGRNAQVCVPYVYFPPGHYDFRSTLEVHPSIRVVGAPANGTRIWFRSEDGQYVRNTGGYPNQNGEIACLRIPHLVVDEDGREWKGRDSVVQNLNVRSMVDAPTVGVLVEGHQTNMRIEGLHFVAENHRAFSYGVNGVPALDGSTADARWADANVEAFLEYVGRGVVFTGWGNRIDVRHYYGALGVHVYGQGGQKDGNFVRVYSDRDGHPGDKTTVVACIDRTKRAHVTTTGEIWLEDRAPRRAGGFNQGDPIF